MIRHTSGQHALYYKYLTMCFVFVYVQIVGGKMMDQGPVLIISFSAQQMAVVRDPVGKVIEGDPVSTRGRTH